MEKTLLRVHVKGRSLFLVKGAKPGPTPAAALERDMLADQLGEVEPLLDLIHHGIARTGHGALIIHPAPNEKGGGRDRGQFDRRAHGAVRRSQNRISRSRHE